MSKQEIINQIAAITDRATLRAIQVAAYERQKQLDALTIHKWTVGDQVEFTGKRGNRVSGQIVKIMQKNVVVETFAEGRWKVPAGMLRVAS